MKTNITISVDSVLVDRARRKAASQGRTVTEAVREFLVGFTSKEDSSSELDCLFARLNYSEAGRRFTRDEMNER